ncbi:MAG: DUF554 domain-containing protein [Syntrophomonadaceae bacterium]|nr:DUF554 domain-containing protein [Syntrophomonadaceae bacterium]MDD4550072.1 DUF554 domain-containing protein [Syntrophomonadaceae bacterium]
MTGTFINAGVIIVAGAVGLLLRKGIPEEMNCSLQNALGLLILVIGIYYGIKADSFAVVGLSLAIGVVIGEWRQWEHKLENLGARLEKMLGGEKNQFTKGFVSASLVFCIGAMGVIGALENGLTGDYHILLIKSILDGILAIIFSASMGVGVLFSSIPVLFYQGAISLAAGLLKPFVNDVMLNNITAMGGILIAGLGLNILGVAKIRVANFLPGIFLVPFVMWLLHFIAL